MNTQFNLVGSVTLTNLNLRRENHGEDTVTGVDLDFKMPSTPMTVVEELLSVKLADALKNSPGVSINTAGEFIEHEVKLNYSLTEDNIHTFKTCKVKGVAFNSFLNDQCEMKFKVQITPTEADVHWLVDGLNFINWEIDVSASQGELDLEGEEVEVVADGGDA